MSTKLAALAATLTVANAAGPWASKMETFKAKHMLSTFPTIPNQFYAEIHDNVTGNVSAIPDGVSVMKQWYDYTNKRLRKDFDDGTSKIYDYKTVRCFFRLFHLFLFLSFSLSYYLIVGSGAGSGAASMERPWSALLLRNFVESVKLCRERELSIGGC